MQPTRQVVLVIGNKIFFCPRFLWVKLWIKVCISLKSLASHDFAPHAQKTDKNAAFALINTYPCFALGTGA
jgi:hypothetical protein